MKKTILVLALILGVQFLNIQTAKAISCSIRYSPSYFSKSEVKIALSDIINLLFQAKVAFLEDLNNRKSERCHLELDVIIFPGTLSVIVKFGEKTYSGGSHQIALVGLREAIIRAFYQEELFRRKICKLFGNSYNLNCIAFAE